MIKPFLLFLAVTLAACAPRIAPAPAPAPAEAAAPSPVASPAPSPAPAPVTTVPVNPYPLDDTVAGTWEGASQGITVTPTRMVIMQNVNQISGSVYFDVGSGFEYFGELQGTAVRGYQGWEANFVIVFPDRGYTNYVGLFQGDLFTAVYHYVTPTGVLDLTSEAILYRQR